jgi:hypothetical protein
MTKSDTNSLHPSSALEGSSSTAEQASPNHSRSSSPAASLASFKTDSSWNSTKAGWGSTGQYWNDFPGLKRPKNDGSSESDDDVLSQVREEQESPDEETTDGSSDGRKPASDSQAQGSAGNDGSGTSDRGDGKADGQSSCARTVGMGK